MKSEPFDFKDDVQLSNSTTMQNPKTTFCVHVACRLLKMTSGCLTSTNVSKCISWLHYQNSKTVSCGIPSEKNNKMCTLLVVDGRCVQKEERKLCRCGRWLVLYGRWVGETFSDSRRLAIIIQKRKFVTDQSQHWQPDALSQHANLVTDIRHRFKM